MFNMGVDEALLRSAAAGRASLRFYRWSGEWVSLGYAQVPDQEFVRRCAEARVGWVRRLTGGRALLHGRDLTYAVAAPRAELPGNLQQVSAKIAEGLQTALRAVGVPAQRAPATARSPGADVFDCFAQPAGNEILLEGRKLVGSAQRRTRDALLQHGSICLAPHSAAVRRTTRLDGGGAVSLKEWGCPVAEGELRDALAAALEAALGITVRPADVDPDEAREASRRLQEIPPGAAAGIAGDAPLAGGSTTHRGPARSPIE